jgi:hypothetical protein
MEMLDIARAIVDRSRGESKQIFSALAEVSMERGYSLSS